MSMRPGSLHHLMGQSQRYAEQNRALYQTVLSSLQPAFLQLLERIRPSLEVALNRYDSQHKQGFLKRIGRFGKEPAVLYNPGGGPELYEGHTIKYIKRSQFAQITVELAPFEGTANVKLAAQDMNLLRKIVLEIFADLVQPDEESYILYFPLQRV